jgi:hypothetical protein
MPEEVRAAVFGNVGTFVSFRVGATDAEYIEKEFAPTLLAQDIVNLGFAQIYLRLMIDGIGSQPFSAKTLPPIAKTAENYVAEIIESSRAQFSKPRDEVEAKVRELLESGREEEKPKPQKDNKPRDDKNSYQNKPKSNYQNDRPKNNNQENRKPIFDESTRRELDRSIKRQIMDIPIDDLPIESDIPIEAESLSIKKLDKKREAPNDPKKVSAENRNSLKDALASVLGALPPVQDNKIQESKPVNEEVSADKLKDVLDIK